MNQCAQPERIPVNILTGFLGSGKTTLLKRLLGEPALADCAVLINEFGEIGLDHRLLGLVEHETVVLQNGCICCSVRDDLRQALLDLHDRRERNLIPPFNRVIIESTGLADPAPVLNTIVRDPVLRHHYRPGMVVATVDALHALDQLARQDESRKQAAIADRLVITKADLVDAAQLDAVRDALRQINASAWLTVSRGDAGNAEILLTEDVDLAASRMEEVRRWFPAAGTPAARYAEFGRAAESSHRGDISTLSLTFDQPIDWIAFGIWLTMLLHSRGADILRVKGILNIQGSELPLVIHGVQQMIHPPLHLPAWPDDERRSQLVLIGKLPARALIEASLQAFLIQ
ncbi:MAG: cobalamin biosynthesis protein CobW [Herbaspirillum sp.]|nr:cobalamin biosynthesis protein CobW [Herbaspirillum sp.]